MKNQTVVVHVTNSSVNTKTGNASDSKSKVDLSEHSPAMKLCVTT